MHLIPTTDGRTLVWYERLGCVSLDGRLLFVHMDWPRHVATLVKVIHEGSRVTQVNLGQRGLLRAKWPRADWCVGFTVDMPADGLWVVFRMDFFFSPSSGHGAGARSCSSTRSTPRSDASSAGSARGIGGGGGAWRLRWGRMHGSGRGVWWRRFRRRWCSW